MSKAVSKITKVFPFRKPRFIIQLEEVAHREEQYYSKENSNHVEYYDSAANTFKFKNTMKENIPQFTLTYYATLM